MKDSGRQFEPAQVHATAAGGVNERKPAKSQIRCE